jgi:hypothetical protein
VHSTTESTFVVTNIGGTAIFSFRSDEGYLGEESFEDAPFTMSPGTFELGHGQSITITVMFRPKAGGPACRSFDVVPSDFTQRFAVTVRAEGNVPQFRFAMCDDTSLLLPFLPVDANRARSVEVINCIPIPTKFHLEITKPSDLREGELSQLYPETEMLPGLDQAPIPFRATPLAGAFDSNGTVSFGISFCPSMFAYFAANILFYADDIPDKSGSLCSVCLLTMFAEGTSGPPSVITLPPVMLGNDVVPRVIFKQGVEIVNNSMLFINVECQNTKLLQAKPNKCRVEPQSRFPISFSGFVEGRVEDIARHVPDSIKYHRTLVEQFKGYETWFLYSPHLALGAAAPVKKKNIIRSPSSSDYSFGVIRDGSLLLSDLDAIQEDGDPDAEAASSADPTDAEEDGESRQLSLAYRFRLIPPRLTAYPPTLDFGSVLAERKASRSLKLVNGSACPIWYKASFPRRPEWQVDRPTGVVTDEQLIEITLNFAQHVVVEDRIVIKTFWASPTGVPMGNCPTGSIAVPVYAMFDRPIVHICDRVMHLGTIFPMLSYESSAVIELRNSFATDFALITQKRIARVQMAGETEQKKEPPASQHALKRQASILDMCRASPTASVELEEFVRAAPLSGHLNPGDAATIKFSACFAGLGDQAQSVSCRILGTDHSLLITATVIPPKITLVTPMIEFSDDFVICNRSHREVIIKNECGVPSTVKIEMVDDCGGVFLLERLAVTDIEPFDRVTVNVSCYSEIHGDYHGLLRLRIRDPWQQEEIMIPLHVKAKGSFFDFQKHTLGFRESGDGNLISFGTEIKFGMGKVIRRLGILNFSSEAITVDWTIANYVHRKQYASLEVAVNEDGTVGVDITERPDADIQYPFRLLTERSMIESHGKTIIVVEFTPPSPGRFAGCVAARSGEFIHMVDLEAIVVA